MSNLNLKRSQLNPLNNPWHSNFTPQLLNSYFPISLPILFGHIKFPNAEMIEADYVPYNIVYKAEDWLNSGDNEHIKYVQS